MAFLRSSWRSLAALAVLCFLPLGLGCGGGSDSSGDDSKTPTVTISGTVTYTRKPLLIDADGKPTGLETDTAKFVSMPLRGVTVRIFQAEEETDSSGNPVNVWKVLGSTVTNGEGKYAAIVDAGKSTFVEIASFASDAKLRLAATTISDAASATERPFYFLRKSPGGTTPAGDPTPGATVDADATVDFAIGLDSRWWKSLLKNTITETTTTVNGAPVITFDPIATEETTGTGSRVAAILDSAYTFGSVFGSPTPGNNLYLHYDPTSSDARPSFMEYVRDEQDSRYFDGGSRAYFGHIRGTAANDDAWDEGVLFPLFARNSLLAQRFTTLLPTSAQDDRSDLQDLRPDMALLEGFSEAMAAILLKSPYLADTRAGAISYRDIRMTGGLGSDAYSAANIAAIAWKLNLHANGTLNGTTVTPVADTKDGWATLARSGLTRFFTVAAPLDENKNATDIASIYGQIARLQEARAATDLVDLAAFFPDATLTTLLQPFHITWPRPKSTATLPDPLVPEAGFMADWGADPNSATKALPAFKLSMAYAHPNRENVYPNFSKGEVHIARLTRTKDENYKLTLQGLAPGVRVEVRIDGVLTYVFDGPGTQSLMTLFGNATTPVLHRIQFRILSPDVLSGEQVITARLDP